MYTSHAKVMISLLLSAFCVLGEPGPWAHRGAAEERASVGVAPPLPHPHHTTIYILPSPFYF